MPRGKYDRKVSRIHRLEQELQKAAEKTKAMKIELDKAHIELKAAKKVAEVTAHTPSVPQVVPAERFTLLRDNLKVMTESRRLLAESEGAGAEVVARMDSEINAHLNVMADMRQATFGVRDIIALHTQQTIPMPAQTHFISAMQQTG